MTRAPRPRCRPLTRAREDRLLSALAFADRAVRTVPRADINLAFVRRMLRQALVAVEGRP